MCQLRNGNLLKSRFSEICVKQIRVNPLLTCQGRNQPLYEHHVTKSGRKRVNQGVIKFIKWPSWKTLTLMLPKKGFEPNIGNGHTAAAQPALLASRSYTPRTSHIFFSFFALIEKLETFFFGGGKDEKERALYFASASQPVSTTNFYPSKWIPVLWSLASKVNTVQEFQVNFFFSGIYS